MQNKGFVKFFAITLGLICLFYLSFSLVANRETKKAEKAATINGEFNQVEYNRYIDSISGVQVWNFLGIKNWFGKTDLGYTYKECLEREISLGLDLKGGMNVTLEVSVPDILKALSNNSTNPEFNNALALASERQQTSQKDYLTLFYEAYTETDKNARLSAIFGTLELKDDITSSSTNEQVMSVLRNKVDGAISNSFNVLRSRIDRFGVVQPNIQRLEGSGRILVELPGIKEKERVRKLLQGTANLEFYRTYSYQEVFPYLQTANNVIRDFQSEQEFKEETDSITAPADETLTAQSTDTVTNTMSSADSLLKTADVESSDNLLSSEEATAQFKKENPLFYVLNQDSRLMNPEGAVVGFSRGVDTAIVNKYLSMRPVKDKFPPDLQFKWAVKPYKETNFYQLYAIKTRDGKPALGGNVVTNARDGFGERSTSQVTMSMDAEGTKTWAALTRDNIGRAIAIVLDDYVYSAPNVSSEIPNGQSVISGDFSPEEAKDLANVLKSGTMPAPARIVQEDIVGPSLGQEAIDSGLTSFAIAFLVVMLYMIFYYGWKPGLIADFALLTNLFFLVGILVAWRATLTLPGIAGIVLTMGMAIDSNVLIYERIREELKAGKNIKKAVTDGFNNAISAILDSNITTLLTGIILAWFGTGPIQGFATTLIIGILTSVFTAVFVTRLILEWLANKDKLNNVPFTSSLTKNWFQNTRINFLGARKVTYIISGVMILVAGVSLATRGLNPGIDFTGGRNYTVRFDKTVSTQEVADLLTVTFDGETMNVTTIGTDDQVRISTNYGIDNNSEAIDDEIENRLYTGLKPLLAADVTEEMFVKGYVVDGTGTAHLSADKDKGSLGIQSSQKVGPTIADDIKKDAFWAVLFSLLAIGLYILIRFRDVSFSVGAVASLVHGAIFVLGAYSLLYSIMPFSMEVDQQFIAAILTVIGYAINDTVVVFDRIREIIGLYPKRDRKAVINESLNATLSRTFSTTFSTLLVLIIIFIFGGDVIRGFIFALLIGIAAGAYSTLFVAAPIAYDIQKKKAGKAALEK